jgi:hypothetical protein
VDGILNKGLYNGETELTPSLIASVDREYPENSNFLLTLYWLQPCLMSLIMKLVACTVVVNKLVNRGLVAFQEGSNNTHLYIKED